MNKISMIWIAVVAVLVIGGCSNETPLVEKEPVNTSVQGLELTKQPHAGESDEASGDQSVAKAADPSPSVPAPSAENATSQADASTSKEQGEDVVSSLKELSLISKTMEEVRQQLGEAKTTAKGGGFTSWQYDHPGKEGYHYPETAVSVDVQGLDSGSMKAQLMISFNENNLVDSYSIYHLVDGEIMVYRVTEAGAVEEPGQAD
ncbi:hypothetical protein M3664_25505 [Paenibacillus lautus]|uniref:hypothetical protein n=1 Tax=Paenibacillus lautus TaxID=1401 RepID=UPI00203D54DA|nr:hypothetical protein [Paenibacillus lautus]MCM3261147.1 hypothetical protein [Paenibacillus lautus]